MFERRPVLGVLICLTLVLTIWQISPRDVTVYREATSPYLSSALPSLASKSPARTANDQLKLPFDSDEGNDIDGDRQDAYAIDHRRNSNSGGTSATYLNITSPVWLAEALAAAAAAAAGSLADNRAGSRNRWDVLAEQETVTRSSISRSRNSTQSTASLTLASAWEDSLPNDDYTSLIDLKDFEFTINRDYCGAGTGRSKRKRRRRASLFEDSLPRAADALPGTRSPASPPLVLVLIHSAPDNLAKRNTIRSSWGLSDARARLIFLMGAVNSTTSQRAIEHESRTYDDIVQGNFVDAYRNMTYKHVMALKWFVYHCPGARYVLKTDDDVFINTPVLYDVLEQVATLRNLLLCQLVTNQNVKRTHRSKWFVSWREYPSRSYPPYCPGYTILYSADVAWLLYREAQRQPFFWIDDVHITGTVAQRVNVTVTPMDGLYLDSDAKRDLLDHRIDGGRKVFFFTDPNLPMDEIRRLWESVRPQR